MPLGSGHPSHVSAALYQTGAPGGHFLTPSAMTMAQSSELMPTYGTSHHQLQHHPSNQQQFFISAPPPEAILYAASASAALHPQIVAFNEKVS